MTEHNFIPDLSTHNPLFIQEKCSRCNLFRQNFTKLRDIVEPWEDDVKYLRPLLMPIFLWLKENPSLEYVIYYDNNITKRRTKYIACDEMIIKAIIE